MELRLETLSVRENNFNKMKPNPNSENELFIYFLGLKAHDEYNHTYMLWDFVQPNLEWNEIYEQHYVGYVNYCSINNFKFKTNWNWLMYAVQQVRKRIIEPLDQDWNNYRHDQYQGLRKYLLAKQEEAEIGKLYEAVVEMMKWWIMYDDYRKRKGL